MPCHAARIGALAVIGLLLAGCSSGGEPSASQSASAASTDEAEPSAGPANGSSPTPAEESESEESESEESESDEPTASESESAEASAPASDELTPPGTELALGEQATVTESLTDGSLIGLTVTSIEPGAIEDLAEFDLDAEERENLTPFYVSVVYENLGEVDLGNESVGSLAGYVGAAAYQPTIFFADFERCQNESAPTELPQGASFESCLTYLVEDGPLDQVGWDSGPEDANYLDDPVVWKP